MGRRGPVPKGLYEDRRVVLSTRITPALHNALERVVRESPTRTISNEVEARLRKSFDSENYIDLLGGEQTFAILRTIAAALDMSGRTALFTSRRKVGGAPDWLNDPYAYDQAVKAVMTVLKAFRPEGDPTPPKFSSKDIAESVGGTKEEGAAKLNVIAAQLGSLQAEFMLREVSTAEPMEPLPGDRPARKVLAQRIKTGLGPIAERLTKENGRKTS